MIIEKLGGSIKIKNNGTKSHPSSLFTSNQREQTTGLTVEI